MRISFVIPAYNEEEYIMGCLNSLLRELQDKAYDAQIIVVNNASTDSTRKIAESFRQVTVVDEPKKSLARARQRGFLSANGDLIANIDADTRMPQGWIEEVCKEFESRGSLIALSGPFIYYDLPVMTRYLTRVFYALGFGINIINHLLLKKGAMLQGGNFVVRRSALERIGGYDLRFDFYGEDTDIARRLQELGDVTFSFQLPIYSSGRRLKQEGTLITGWRYCVNHFWTMFFKEPFTTTATDVR
jgi:glycosyltransferase involved in cell wall biosynthesis